MRVLQLIDSLRSGGAERMSVTYANALAKRIHGSFLCCTRKEGLLKKQISPDVGYLFLNKESTLDLQAFRKLRRFVKDNKVDLIQAHSSSWFLALLVKLSLSGVKLVWHDHYGRDLKQRKSGLLKPASKHFDGIITVNKDLETWSEKNLHSKEVRYIKNFLPEILASGEMVKLKGGDSFKIICVANFRPQKDHQNLLQAFSQALQAYSNISLHLIGKEEQTAYCDNVRRFIEENDLLDKVFIYGEQENIPVLLKQADLGVLASTSEGLPVALIEYGSVALPVVCTDVGECAQVIGEHGIVVPPHDPVSLATGILKYYIDEPLRKTQASNFHQQIIKYYSEVEVIEEVKNFYLDLVD